MEQFLAIDWTPSIKDIVDDTFINEERLRNESVIYKMMSNTYADPLLNMEEDYKKISSNFSVSNIQEDSDIGGTEDNANQKSKKKSHKYIPGIIKAPFKISKHSKLTEAQQALCLKVLLSLSPNLNCDHTQVQKEDLKYYMELQDVINKEQEEYLQLIEKHWNTDKMQIICEEFITAKWNEKISNINKLPRYYVETKNVPFVSERDVKIDYVKTCFTVGSPFKLFLPPLTKPTKLNISCQELLNRYCSLSDTDNNVKLNEKLPVSLDAHCSNLVEVNDVDLVISSSGLKCLVNNIGSDYKNSWTLPFLIKQHNGKNIIYIEKPIPQSANNIIKKNTWVYKYILKHFLRPIEKSREKHIQNNIRDDDIFGDIHGELLLKLEEENDHTTSSKFYETNVLNEDSSTANRSKNSDDNHFKKSKIQSKNNMNSTCHQNVTYKIFKIGTKAEKQNELMKTAFKEYKILIRCKEDGYEELSNGSKQSIIFVPKLEHQAAFGAEAVTLEEAMHQWISTVIRPNAVLKRVRISAQTAEIYQIESHNSASISRDIKRLHNVNVDDSLATLHNIIENLQTLGPGRYIIKHTERNGAFAVVLKETENPGKNVFDLDYIRKGFRYATIPLIPWPTLDKLLPTPAQIFFERLPATFRPKPILKSKRLQSNKTKANLENKRVSKRLKKKK